MATILIVEDEEQVLVLTQSYLREQGHQTLSAATAEQAFAILDVTERIDVILTDIVLLGDAQAGLDLGKEAVKHRPDLKVLYTTGQAITDGMKAMMVKDSAILGKPYTVDQLQAALLVHLGIRPNSPNVDPVEPPSSSNAISAGKFWSTRRED